MKKSEFLTLVKEEATHLRKKATNAEKRRLSYESLLPCHADFCLYGLMTGNCFSKRARRLTPKTLLFVGESSMGTNDKFPHDTFTTLKPQAGLQFTPIEVYLLIKGSKSKKLINYIKGETETFEP